MARSTGPILAVGAVTLINRTVFNGQSVDWRVPIATALATGILALGEKIWPAGAVGVAWIALFTITMTRVDPTVPAPAESALRWFNERQ